jgi:UDP-N-acetylglucosamine 2-epimerase (non-hydrolysing)
VPCLTIRENTERPVTIEEGTNQLVGLSPAVILAAAHEVIDRGRKPGRLPALWDGAAATRILDVLEDRLSPSSKDMQYSNGLSLSSGRR